MSRCHLICSTLITHSKKKKKLFHVSYNVSDTIRIGVIYTSVSTHMCVCVCVSLLTPRGLLSFLQHPTVGMVRPETEARETKPHNLWSDKRGEDDRHLKIAPATAAEWPFSRVTILHLPAKGHFCLLPLCFHHELDVTEHTSRIGI